MRYIAQGHYIVDTTTDIAVCRSVVLKGTNLLADAEQDDAGKKWAVVVAAALNAYNDKQGGL